MSNIKFYNFKVVLNGCGKNEDEAWQDAIDSFCSDPGHTPDKEDIEDVTGEMPETDKLIYGNPDEEQEAFNRELYG